MSIWKHHFEITVNVLITYICFRFRFAIASSYESFDDYFCLQLESVDTYSLALYGAGAFFGIWLVSAIVGAVDSIPLVSSSYIIFVRVCMSLEGGSIGKVVEINL